MSLRTIGIAITISFLFAAATPAFAALTEKEVETLVRSEKTWTNRSGLSVKINQNELTITIGTYREPGATDKDMKIDSVMITRKIMDSDPDIARVKVRFYDPVNRSNFQLVDVRQSDVKAFREGLVDIDALLAGIDILKFLDAQVSEGPFATERLAAKQHIEKLREQGVGVAAYMQLFSQAEELAAKINKEPVAPDVEKNKTDLRTSLDRLNKAFDDQAAFVKQQKEKALAKLTDAANKSRSAQQTAQSPTGATASKPKWQPPPADVDPKTGLERLGRFTPIPGPFLLDRIYVARKIVQLEKNNSPVTNLIPGWQRMEAAARRHDEVGVRGDLEALQRQLGMPALTDEERNAVNVIKSPRI